jgi:hypothetical protein
MKRSLFQHRNQSNSDNNHGKEYLNYIWNLIYHRVEIYVSKGSKFTSCLWIILKSMSLQKKSHNLKITKKTLKEDIDEKWMNKNFRQKKWNTTKSLEIYIYIFIFQQSDFILHEIFICFISNMTPESEKKYMFYWKQIEFSYWHQCIGVVKYFVFLQSYTIPNWTITAQSRVYCS